jgi:hypothetical protein
MSKHGLDHYLEILYILFFAFTAFGDQKFGQFVVIDEDGFSIYLGECLNHVHKCMKYGQNPLFFGI